jgi:hypothetical protein
VKHHLCTKFVFFTFYKLDRTPKMSFNISFLFQVIVYSAPLAPMIIRVSSLCFSLNTELGEMFVPTGIDHFTNSEPTFRSPFLAGNTQPLPRYTLSHPSTYEESHVFK